MKITKRQLRTIIRESILSEMLPPGHPVPRSVQADYDIANKEDTFPKRKLMKPKVPTSDELGIYENVRSAITDAMKGIPGFKSHMAGQAITVELPVGEVEEILQPLFMSLGVDVADGTTSEGSLSISHPGSPDMRVYMYQVSGTFANPDVPETEIDFGIPPGEGEAY